MIINFSQKEDPIINELDKIGIQVSSSGQTLELNLPENFSGANLGLKKIICEEGGYDLSSYAGQIVQLHSYNSNRYYGDEPLNVWVIASESEIVCVYFAVKESSTLIPGILSINDSYIVEK